MKSVEIYLFTLFTCLIYIHHNFRIASTGALLGQLVFVAKINDYYSGINSYLVDRELHRYLFVLCCFSEVFYFFRVVDFI